MNTQNVTRLLKIAKSKVSKHSPEILTGIGIAGMITTTVFAVKATPKALKKIEERKEELNLENEGLKPAEIVKTCWKCYAPAVATGAFSIACLVGANSVNARRNAALATAYKISETALSEYREKVVETIGEKKEQAVRDAVAKDKVEKNPVSKTEVIITEKGNTLCYDAHSDRYFKSDIDKIRRAVNNLNYRMTSGMEMYISLNEFYDEIGLSHTQIGDDLGWVVNDGLIDISFSSQIADNDTPCIVIEHLKPPVYNYNKLY